LFALGELVRIVDGRLLRPFGDAHSTRPRRAMHDSRGILPGDLFVALRGQRTDGHRFVEDAFARGAVAALIAAADPLPDNARNLVLVEDPLGALQRLAAAWRRTLSARFVAITGSCGKTTTKQTAFELIRGTRATFAAPANYNTEIGVPLSLLATPEDAEVALIEIGADRPGDIRRLTPIVDPEIAVITRIGHSHLDGLGSIRAVAEEKWSLVNASPHLRTAILNVDDRHLRRRASAWPGRTIGYGTKHGDLRGAAIGRSPPLRLALSDPAVELSCPLVGAHHAHTVLAAAATALELGVPVGALQKGAARCRPVARRLEPKPAAFGLILDDSYNANPESTLAALDALAQYASDLPGRGYVFGEMRGLGASTSRWHHAILRHALRLGIDPIIPVGAAAERAVASLAKRQRGAIHRLPHERLAVEIPAMLRDRDPTILLVKGSRDVGLERLVDALVEPTPGPA
jgi:UDP-N-acetylmuramoyl-tripeptide--D-alanyl-D-alanine ligase